MFCVYNFSIKNGDENSEYEPENDRKLEDGNEEPNTGNTHSPNTSCSLTEQEPLRFKLT